jgi:hypothetical protein
MKNKTEMRSVRQFQTESLLKIDENSTALASVINSMGIGDHKSLKQIKNLQSQDKQNNDINLNAPAEIKVSV